MKNTFFKSFMAIAAVVASFAFTACDDSENGTTFLDPDVELSVETLAFTQAEESKTFDITVDADWKVDVPVSADWLTVTPLNGGAGQHTLTVSVAANNTGSAREAILRVIALHPVYDEWDIEKLTVSQSATEEEIKPLEVVYSDNFDKKEAVKDGNYWPWLKDTAADYTNPQGSGAANVAYESANVTVRANSASDSNYSDYAGSGLNNLFFGARINYVTVSGIEMPAEGDCFVLSFGSEKYSQEGDSTFNNDEFHVYISSDNTLWSEVEYAFEEGDELSGRWNDAKASFRLASVPSTLSIMVSADVASVYRLDDLQLSSGGEGAQLIDLAQGVENPNEPETPDTPDTPVEGSFFTDNFDKKEAVKDASGYWPYMSADYGNAVGDGAATVSYDSKNVTVRANSMSNGSYSAYEGSGLNNLFFGKEGNYVEIRDITLPAGEDTFMMTFGAEKYTQNGDSVFKYDEFHVYLSADNATWSEITYSFADGDNLDGTWNDASATFRLTEVPAKLSVKFSVDVASVYRLDDVVLGVAESATQDVTLSEGSGTPEEPAGDEVTVTEAIGLAQGTTVKVKESTVVAVSARSYLLTDGTSYILAYAGADPGLAVGDKVTVSASIGAYRSVPQLADPVATKVGHDDAFTHPEPVVMDGAAADAFLTSTYIKYVKMTGKLVKSGNYWNVELEGASTAQGSVSYPTAAMCPDELDGTVVDIYGYTIYQTRDTDVNIIATHVVPTGETPEEPEQPEQPEEPEQPIEPGDVVTVAQFLAAAESESVTYRLSGTITKVANTQYGNFDLTDDTGTVYIYGLCSPTGAQQYWAESGAKLGDDIVIETIRTSYSGSPQGKNAIFVSLQSPGTRAFWSPESAAVTLGAAGQSVNVALNAYNLTESVNVTSDNAAISASYANGVVTISAGANETDAVINATVTVACGSLSHTIAVTQLKQSSGGGEVVSVEKVMSAQGWANAQAVKELVMDENITVTFAQGSANNAPAYYTSGNAVRLYQNGATMTVTASNGKVITAIDIEFANNHYYMEPDCGEFSAEAATRSWSGEAGSVKFTTTGTDKDHRAYVAKIKVTYM
ncbi:MAG: BACON domain-containing protein [Alistipes sp.]|nr:BACON domain-containing protein [Alistipes sp.]